MHRPSRKKIPHLALLLNLLSAACSHPQWAEFHSLAEAQPFVVEIEPKAESRLAAPLEFTLNFSHRIDLVTLDSTAVVLLPEDIDNPSSDAVDDFIQELVAGEKPTIPLQYLLDAGETNLTLFTDAELPTGIYSLVVTPSLRSISGIPFNQQPGRAPTLFIARFVSGDLPLPQPGTGEEPGDGGPNTPIFGPEPEFLVVNEFLYDGKTSETDGEAFVELYGTAGADISLYQILFLNGENGEETERVTLPPGSLLGEDGIFLVADLRTNSSTLSQVPNPDFLDQFDPQNGPDGLQVLGRQGNLRDTAAYGEGSVTTAVNGLALGEGDPAADVAGGHSLSRTAGADSANNATDFSDQATPSPGLL